MQPYNSTTGNEDLILKSLNDQQKAAVLSGDGPVLIIAGAGSGKTRVITSKIALLLNQGVAPSEILALTFTKKAAEEMRKRICAMSGDSAQALVMGTFHSVFVRFLREWSSYIGFPANFTIYDTDDAQNCLHECIGETLYGERWNDKEYIKSLSDEEAKERKRMLGTIYKTKDIAAIISRLKNEYIMPKEFNQNERLSYYERTGRGEIGKIYELYMKRCRRAAAMDFDDILDYMNYLMEEVPQAAKIMARRFRYILVDEFQDTNAVQYNILYKLALGHGNICAVGDDSQSIYAFRGAKIQNILNFKNDYSNVQIYKLEVNYRSTPEIVEAANRLIENNKYRLEKTCRAYRPAGVPIREETLPNDRAEARFIAQCIRERHFKGNPYSDNAVLYRTNAQSRALEDAMRKEHIPYIIYSGMSFFERQEIKDVLAYMRLCLNPHDDEAFKRICNRPARAFSEKTLAYVSAQASMGDVSLTTAAGNIVSNPGDLKPATVKGIKNFLNLMDDIRRNTSGMDALEATEYINESSGIYELYNKEEGDDGHKRSTNIDSLLNDIRYFIDDYEDLPDENGNTYKPDLSIYLDNITLKSAADVKDNDTDCVALMTSHCSKGLEFPTVFIAGVEDGLYPSVNPKRETESEVEEERRLFYVSMTRAKNELILTNCETRWKYNEIIDCKPSRFLYEIY